jgi:hypothetical protein
MDIPATLDTAKFRQLVLQGIEELSGGGAGASSTNSAVGPDGVTRVPLNVNAAGELKVNVEASIDADLAQIESQLNTIIGIETPQAADVAAIKSSAASIAGNTSSGSTASVSSFTSTSSATIVASGTRKAITIYNAGAGDLYVLLGTGTASSTTYSFIVGVADLVTVASYTGAIQGIFSAAGTARISIIT